MSGDKPRPDVEVRNEYHISGLTVILRQKISDWMQLALLDVNTPIDENTTHTRWILARSFFRSPLARFFLRADKDSHKRTMKVFYQDQVVVEDIKPILVPQFDEEMSIKSDALQIRFRRQRERWVKRGWAIDVDQWRQSYGDRRAVSLPSPRRSELSEKNWVVKTVPLLEPSKPYKITEKPGVFLCFC